MMYSVLESVQAMLTLWGKFSFTGAMHDIDTVLKHVRCLNCFNLLVHRTAVARRGYSLCLTFKILPFYQTSPALQSILHSRGTSLGARLLFASEVERRAQLMKKSVLRVNVQESRKLISRCLELSLKRIFPLFQMNVQNLPFYSVLDDAFETGSE